MIRRFLKRFTNQRRFTTLTTLLITCVGFIIIYNFITNRIRKIDFSNLSLDDQLLLATMPIFIILIVQNIFQMLYHLIYKDRFIISGINVGSSSYNYKKVIDKKTKEIVLVSQNFRGAMNDSLKDKIKELLENNGNVVLIGTTYEAMSEICKGDDRARKHFFSSLEDIRNIYENVENKDFTKNFYIIFHPSASSLTTFYRDPFSEKASRRLLIIGPKYAQDKNKENRYYNVIEAWDNNDFYQLFRDHLFFMADPQNNPQTIYEFCRNILANHSKDIENKKYEDLLNWFVANHEFSNKHYKIYNYPDI